MVANDARRRRGRTVEIGLQCKAGRSDGSESRIVIPALAGTLALVVGLGAALLAWRSRLRSRRRLERVVRQLDRCLGEINDSLAGALENSRRIGPARAAELGLTLDLDELLSKIAREAANRTGAEAAAVRVRGPSDEPAVGAFGSDQVAYLLESTFHASGGRPFRAITINWIFPPVLETDEDVFRSALVVPVVEAGVETGAIAGYARKPAAFRPEHARALETLAAEAADGISTARRFTALRLRSAPARGNGVASRPRGGGLETSDRTQPAATPGDARR